MSFVGDVLGELGIAEPQQVLSEVIRVRVEESQLQGLDRIEENLRGRGFRTVNRSSLIRAAVARFIDDVEKLP